MLDVEAAARKALAGDATAIPKATTGSVESTRTLTVARDSAVKARSIALTQLQGVLVTAPAELREQITARGGRGEAARCRKFRPAMNRIAEPTQAGKLTLRTLGQCVATLDSEIDNLNRQLKSLVAATAPTLITRTGISNGHAAQFLITAGENIDRLRSDAASARLCGVEPIPISSERTHRMRLDRGGDRQANRAYTSSPSCACDSINALSTTCNDAEP